jgi:ATP-dependent DNA helicase RecQ
MIDQSEGDAAHRRKLTAHLDAMLALCETVECRRVQLLGYFGQTSTPCGNCDTCLTPPVAVDGTVPAQKLLSTVVRLKRERNQQFGAGHLIDILLGKRTPRMTQNGHEALSTFGIGTELSDLEWRGVVRQLLAQGLLAVSPDGYGTLLITEDSSAVLSGSRPVRLRKEPERAARPARSSRRGGAGAVAVDLPVEAQGLFETLRTWRSLTARAAGVPAYVVFGDVTLRGVAAARPTSFDQLAGISGVGQKKLETYGEQLLALVAGEEPEVVAALGGGAGAGAGVRAGGGVVGGVGGGDARPSAARGPGAARSRQPGGPSFSAAPAASSSPVGSFVPDDDANGRADADPGFPPDAAPDADWADFPPDDPYDETIPPDDWR